jgi:hypothetical protein
MEVDFKRLWGKEQDMEAVPAVIDRIANEQK